MPAYRLRALVLRKTKLGETDLIVTLLAEDGRQVRAVAKGARKPGSRFGGRLEPCASVELLLHTGRTLEVVSEAELIDAHVALRDEFEHAMAAATVVDVLDKVSVEGQAEPRLFGLAEATLTAMEAASAARLPQVVCAFLVKAMAMHGYRPELASCASCAASAEGGSGFSLEAGGVVCPECGAGPMVVPFSENARAVLDWMLRARMAEVAGADLASRSVAEALDLLRRFVAYHVPSRMKALEMYLGTCREGASGRVDPA